MCPMSLPAICTQHTEATVGHLNALPSASTTEVAHVLYSQTFVKMKRIYNGGSAGVVLKTLYCQGCQTINTATSEVQAECWRLIRTW